MMLFNFILLLQVARIFSQEQAQHPSAEKIVFDLSTKQHEQNQNNINNNNNHQHLPPHFHLKWITNQTQFPVKLTVSKNMLPNESYTWAWEKSSEQKLVQTLPDYAQDYLLTETDAKSTLILVQYNNQSHSQLSSYEPKLMLNNEPLSADQEHSLLKEENIFSLAYLKQHKIKLEKNFNKNKLSCVADFLISRASQEHIEPIMKLMEKYASFKLAVKAKGKSNLHENDAKQQQEQQQYSPLPALLDTRFNYDQPQMYQAPSSYQQQQQQQQSQYPQAYQSYQMQQPFNYIIDSIQQHQQNQMNQQYQSLQQARQIYQQMMNPEAHYFLQQQQQHLSPQATYFNPAHTQNPYFYSTFKHKRDVRPSSKEEESEQEQVNNDIVENQNDFDKEKFVKVRLTLGPVTLFRPVLTDEIVSCSLDLINIDEVNLDYKSTIYMKMPYAGLDAEVEKVDSKLTGPRDDLVDISVIKSFLHSKNLEQQLNQQVKHLSEHAKPTGSENTNNNHVHGEQQKQESGGRRIQNENDDKYADIFKSELIFSSSNKLVSSNLVICLISFVLYFLI